MFFMHGVKYFEELDEIFFFIINLGIRNSLYIIQLISLILKLIIINIQ